MWTCFISSPPSSHRSVLVMPPVRSPIRRVWHSWAHAKKKMSVYFIAGLDRWVNMQMLTEKERKARKPWTSLIQAYTHPRCFHASSTPSDIFLSLGTSWPPLSWRTLSQLPFRHATFPSKLPHSDLSQSVSPSEFALLSSSGPVKSPNTLLVYSQHCRFV